MRYREGELHQTHEDPTLEIAACPECVSDREAPYIEAEAKYDQKREGW